MLQNKKVKVGQVRETQRRAHPWRISSVWDTPPPPPPTQRLSKDETANSLLSKETGQSTRISGEGRGSPVHTSWLLGGLSLLV